MAAAAIGGGRDPRATVSPMTRSPIGIAVVAAGLMASASASAQQATTTRDARQAYGSRLDQNAVPEVGRGVVHRLQTRISNRIDNRLSTRVERYTATVDPVAALRSNAAEQTAPQPVQTPLPPVPE